MSHEIEAREQAILFQARHDSLTGLPNVEGLLHAAEIKRLLPGRSALIVFGIDDFATISNAFGRQVSDHYLRACAERISNAVPVNSLVARVGTAEVALVSHSPNAADPEALAGQILQTISAPVAVDNITLTLTGSAGIALYADPSVAPETVLQRASTALERARQEARTLRTYSDGDEAAQAYSLTLLQDLRYALEADDAQLFMCYQPKLNLATGRADKAESLIRWQHPTHGAISPEMFIGLAEQSSLMHTLTDWVISTVLADRARWQSALPDLQVAINIASRDLQREDLPGVVQKRLAEHGLDPAALCLELTERDVMGDEAAAAQQLLAFAAAGVELSVDDYGVGQSSLARLRQLPVSEIKIDRQFITELEHSGSDQTIVRSTVELCRSFGMRLVAEGVETPGCLTLLQELGCDYAQGYGICAPIKAGAVLDWFTRSEAAIEEAATEKGVA
jgi:diguanylate cyclase (GGDEF)-like protein